MVSTFHITPEPICAVPPSKKQDSVAQLEQLERQLSDQLHHSAARQLASTLAAAHADLMSGREGAATLRKQRELLPFYSSPRRRPAVAVFESDLARLWKSLLASQGDSVDDLRVSLADSALFFLRVSEAASALSLHRVGRSEAPARAAAIAAGWAFSAAGIYDSGDGQRMQAEAGLRNLFASGAGPLAAPAAPARHLRDLLTFLAVQNSIPLSPMPGRPDWLSSPPLALLSWPALQNQPLSFSMKRDLAAPVPMLTNLPF